LQKIIHFENCWFTFAAMKLTKLKLNKANPRFIRDEKFKKLLKSIQEFPKMMELRPIVYDTDGTVLGGNMRLRALQELGYKDIPDNWAVAADTLTDQEKKRFIIEDNVGFGEWDFDMLANEWDSQELSDWGVDLPTDWGGKLEATEDDYEIPETIQTDIVRGDVFEIGRHRLMCGDSTSSDDVEKLMGGDKADMIFTDPPYDIQNEDYCENIMLYSKNAHVFVMHDDKGMVKYLRLSKLEFSRFYVANFGFSSPRGNDPYLSHILISQEKNGDAITHKNMYDGFRSIIPMEYRFRLKDDKTEHKHQKPIKFVSTFIEHFSNENSLILDLFLGSGTTMVAAHQLNRKCYGMEISPEYCQVIVDRMKKLDPTIEIKKNGITTV